MYLAMNESGSWRAQVRKGWLDLAILAVLWNGRLYGLEILRRLADDSDLVLAEGTIYPVLNRLRIDGLIDAAWEQSDSGHPRKYYELTPAGRRRTVSMTRESTDFIKQMQKLLKRIPQEEQ